MRDCVIQKNQKFRKISHFRVAKDMYKSMLLNGNCLSPSATAIRKSFLIEKELYFNESSDFSIVEDYDLWLRMANNGAVIAFLDKILCDYIVDEDNMINDWEKFIKNLDNLYKYHAYYVQNFDKEKEKIYKQLTAIIHFQHLKQALKVKKYSEAIKEFSKTLSKSPALMPKK